MDLLDDDGLIDLRRRKGDAAARDDLRPRGAELPAANADLTAWRDDARQATSSAAPVAAACHVCGRPPRATCRNCARPVCAAHHWTMLALCDDCAPGGLPGEGRGTPA